MDTEPEDARDVRGVRRQRVRYEIVECHEEQVGERRADRGAVNGPTPAIVGMAAPSPEGRRLVNALAFRAEYFGRVHPDIIAQSDWQDRLASALD